MTRYRSFFWPAVLILIGLVALLVNTGQIPAEKLILLVNLWPLILIVIGLELIVRRTLHGPTGDIGAAVIVAVAVVFATVYVAVEPNPSTSQTLDATAPGGGLHQAAVEIEAGAGTITVSGGAQLGTQLFHAHVEYSGVKPDIAFDREAGSLRISQQDNRVFGIQTPHFVLDLQLNPEVTWKIAETTGASTDTINAARLHVGAITVVSGAGREDLTLGPPQGVVPVDMRGGALTVHIHRPSSTEVSVRVTGGASSLNADGRRMGGIGDLSYQSPGFAGATDAYRITVNGGADSVTLDTATESG